MPRVPTVDYDPFHATTRADPYPTYTRLRDAAPVIRTIIDDWEVYGLTRYTHVHAALSDHHRFTARDGLGVYPVDRWQGGVIVTCDPPEHTRIRRAVAHHTGPAALAGWRAQIQELADTTLQPLLHHDSIDATTDLARPLVTTALADFLGLPDTEREHLPGWADAATNMHGPATARTAADINHVATAAQHVQRLRHDGTLHPQRLGAQLGQAAAAGTITDDEASNLLFGMIVAGIHSSASFLGLLLAALARFPDQWLAARTDPHLIDSLVEEALRYDTPLPLLFRTAATDLDIDGYTVPQGARVMMMYAAANRDPRHWPLPDVLDASRFQYTRRAQHLTFGAGNHLCLGAPLLRLEAGCLLRSLANHRIRRIRAAGQPRLDPNTIVRGYASLPLHLDRD